MQPFRMPLRNGETQGTPLIIISILRIIVWPSIEDTSDEVTHLLDLSDVLLEDVGPEVSLEVRQLRGRLEVVLQRLLVDVLVVEHDALDDALVQHLLVPILQPLRLRDLLILKSKIRTRDISSLISQVSPLDVFFY